MHPIIRPMRAGDVDAVLALQAIAYADAAFAPEGAAVYLNRMKLAPDLCLVAQTAAGDLIGYLVSHPWHDGKPPALGNVLAALPVPATPPATGRSAATGQRPELCQRMRWQATATGPAT